MDEVDLWMDEVDLSLHGGMGWYRIEAVSVCLPQVPDGEQGWKSFIASNILILTHCFCVCINYKYLIL